MPCDFVVIVGELDSERFRRFRLGRDRSAVESITGASGDVNIWALGQSVSDDVWLAIKKGDRMFFAEDGSRFSHCGIVSNTLIDRSVPIKLWSDSPRIRLLDRIVLFSVGKCSRHLGMFCHLPAVDPVASQGNDPKRSNAPAISDYVVTSKLNGQIFVTCRSKY